MKLGAGRRRRASRSAGGTPISDVVVPSRPPVKPAATFRPRTRERGGCRSARERRSRERDDDADRHRQLCSSTAPSVREPSQSPGVAPPTSSATRRRLIAPRSRHATEMRVASEIRRFAVTTNGSEKPVSRSAGVARSPEPEAGRAGQQRGSGDQQAPEDQHATSHAEPRSCTVTGSVTRPPPGGGASPARRPIRLSAPARPSS